MIAVHLLVAKDRIMKPSTHPIHISKIGLISRHGKRWPVALSGWFGIANTAGIYGAVTRIGRLVVGQTIILRAATEKRERG